MRHYLGKILDLSFGDTVKGFRKAESACLYFCLLDCTTDRRTNEYRLKENHTINPSKLITQLNVTFLFPCWERPALSPEEKYDSGLGPVGMPPLSTPSFYPI